MQAYQNLTNQTALEYNNAVADSLAKICSPLYNNFSINHFSYMKIFDNGTRLFLCPNKKWVKYYIENNFQNNKIHPRHRPQKNGIQYALWSSFERDPIFSALYDLDIWNGFTIFDRHEKYMDCFHFATKRENTQISKFYFDYFNVLIQFICYFKDKAFEMINEKNPKNLIFSNTPISYEFSNQALLFEKKVNKFLQEIQVKRYIFENNNNLFSLTKREAECLYLISNGKSAKETGQQLKISNRTVEAYINQIRNKLGFKLANLLLQNRLTELGIEEDIFNLANKEDEK